MPEPTEEQRKAFEEKLKNMSPEELKEFQKQQCIFCQIIAGKVPSKKVYEDDKCIAVMDINPATIGHVLLLPKEHYSIMPQIPEGEVGHLFMVAKHISHAMLKKLKVEGTNIFAANGPAAGQKAQHFMIHIIPRRDGDGILGVSKHLVDENVREKLAEVVGKRVNDLFGIKEKVKKEVKDELEKEDTLKKQEEGKKKEVEKEEAGDKQTEEKEEQKKKKSAAKNSSDHIPKKEAEDEDADAEEDEKDEGEDEEKEEENDEEKNNGDEEKEDTDLDDIAELFK
jgi:histidine triad (HIT) family protein